jgi:hypothetical protein
VVKDDLAGFSHDASVHDVGVKVDTAVVLFIDRH